MFKRLIPLICTAAAALVLAPAAMAGDLPEIPDLPAPPSQEGDNDADFSQGSDSSTGDAVAGSQVTGVVGAADAAPAAPVPEDEPADGGIDPETQKLIDSLDKVLNLLGPALPVIVDEDRPAPDGPTMREPGPESDPECDDLLEDLPPGNGVWC